MRSYHCLSTPQANRNRSLVLVAFEKACIYAGMQPQFYILASVVSYPERTKAHENGVQPMDQFGDGRSALSHRDKWGI
ncbi:unnamed protein product [Calicophoron daubneyi]|uniref:Uncharacterized protein n=1 Tax=Calicophoron daubneyi TaxID=300641 RepID=A0AAV2TRI1_CALDB